MPRQPARHPHGNRWRRQDPTCRRGLAAGTIGRHGYGPFFVDLVPVGDAELIPAALAVALGVHLDPHDDVMARVRSAIADQTLMVVIDNCEHLLPAIAEVISRLLASNRGLLLVATSREPLDVAGERVWPLDPLGVPSDGCSPEQIRNSESAALFLARLPMNLAAHPLSGEEIGAVGDICRCLAGMPLGLELAAPHQDAVAARARRAARTLDQRAEATRPRSVAAASLDARRARLGLSTALPTGTAGAEGDERVRRRLRAGGLRRRVPR